MRTLTQSALLPMMMGIAVLLISLYGAEIGYEEIARAFFVFGSAIVGASTICYVGRKPAEADVRLGSLAQHQQHL